MGKKPFYHLECVLCKQSYSEEETTTRCLQCGNALDIQYDHKYILSRLNKYSLENSPISGLKYLDFYPIKDLSYIVSLEEGNTPLHHSKNIGEKLGFKNLYIKDESNNPTGVFKDRGSLIEITKAKEMKAKAVCCASTGNMAASVSAYASVAGLPCYVFVPEGTPIGKLAQSLAYGARIIQVRGTYNDCVILSEKAAKKHHFYLAGDYAFRAEGQKSIAFEIIEQLFWKAPEYVIVPMGCGTNISAIWKGFAEFHQLGLIDQLPKMIGVQPSNVPTICQAFKEGKKNAIFIEKPHSVASAIGIGKPLDDIKALRALRISKGAVETASEEEILKAQQTLGKFESIFVEPSGAVPIAVLEKLKKSGIIHETSIIVCVATGTGLKDPKSAVSMMPDPPVIEPRPEEVDRYLKFKLYSIRASGMKGKEKELWKKMPSQAQIKGILKKEFNVDVRKKYLEKIQLQVKTFHEKTKKMRKADLQYILENVLKEYDEASKIIEIIDFDLNVSKHKRPVAKVEILFAKEKIQAVEEGVGPVDAIINAIRTAIKKKDTFKWELFHYNVEIDTAGTDAVVEVTMGLRDMNNNEVTASAVSPDVIVASTNAFERAYNLLCKKNMA